MQLSKVLFCFAVLCVTITLAEFRHIPDRSKMFYEETHPDFFFGFRNLESPDHNSHTSSRKNTDPVTVRLQGSTELGYYYVTLFFGSPVQKQTLIVDTGSVTTTVPCSECGHDCGTHHFDKPFNHNISKSFEPFKCDESFGDYSCYDCTGQCPFTVSYVEGSSYRGHFNKDYVVFGNEIEDNFSMLKENQKDLTPEAQQMRESVEETIKDRRIFMPFGCTNKETKLFYDQEADGILGLGVNTNTRSSPPNILDAINLDNSNASKAFSLCLAPNGGYFTIGGYNTAYHLPDEKVQYTRYSDSFGQYKVFIDKIEMEGQNLGLAPSALNSGEGAFFDSGTTLTHVPSATYNAVRNNLLNYCQADDDKCGKNSETASKSFCWKYNPSLFPTLQGFFDTFPTFKFVFGREHKSEYGWKAEDYLYEKEGSENEYCLGLSHYERETILGGTFMKNHDILFDKENRRIGFARADCGAVQEIIEPIFKDKKESNEAIDRNEDSNYEVEVQKNKNFFEFVTNPDRIVINAAIASVLACALVVVVVLICRRYRNKRPYHHMRNINIEVPSAGINPRPFNASNPATPGLADNQPPQEEKLEFEQEQSSTEIRVD